MNARMAKMGVAAALFLGATLLASGAHAQWAVVGAACSPDGTLANSNGFLVCSGGVWVANPIRAGNLSTCNSGNAGYIRWSGSAFEGCNGTSWIQLAGGSSGLKVYQADGVTVLGNYLGSLGTSAEAGNACSYIIYANETTGAIATLEPADCDAAPVNSVYFSGAGCTGTAWGGLGNIGYCCTGSANCTTNKCKGVAGTSGIKVFQSIRNQAGNCSNGSSSATLYNTTPLLCGGSPCLVK